MSQRVEISKRLVLVNSLSAIVNRLLSLGVVLWLHQHLVRRVSAEEYGLYSVMIALITFVPFVTMVLAGGMARFVTEAYARNDTRRVTQIVSTMLPLCLASGALLLTAGLVLSWKIDLLLNVDPQNLGDARLMFGILVLLTSVRLALTPYKLGLHVRQKFLWTHAIWLAAELLKYGVMFALLFGAGTRVLWVVAAAIPATLLDQSLSCALSRRLLPELRFQRAEVRWELVRPILSFGGWTLLNRGVVILREALTFLILNRFATPVQVTSFGLGAMVDTRLRRNATLPLVTVSPALTAMHATRQDERLRRSYFRLGRYFLWVLLLVAAPLVVYRVELWSLYLGPSFSKYEPTTAVMALLLCRVVLLFCQPPLQVVAGAKGKMRALGLGSFVIEAATVALTLYLVVGRDMGAVGAAASAALVTMIGAPIVYWRLGLRMTSSSSAIWMRESVVPGVLPALVATPAWVVLHMLLPSSSWTALAAQLVSGMALYFLALGLFALRSEDRSDLRKLRQRLGWLPNRTP